MNALKFPGHATKLSNTVSSLFDAYRVDNKFSDVRVKVGEQTFYCHKLVLQINSDHFAQLTFPSGTVTLQDIEPNHFYTVLRFMYTGEILLSTDNVESVLDAAFLLQMEDLKTVCFDFLDKSQSNNREKQFTKLSGRITKLQTRPSTKHYCEFNFRMLSNPTNLATMSEDTLKSILGSDDLNVNSEVEVCEMLIRWIQVQTETENDVHPEQFLPLIRWSSINVDYIKARLLQNTTLMSSPACMTFLSKVISYLLFRVQFEGLRTFHRESTGIENCLVIIGLSDATTLTREIHRVSLQKPNSMSAITEMQIAMQREAQACVSSNNVYVTGIGNNCPYNETWKLDALSTFWFKCADMTTGRRRHCAAIVGTLLYVLGGWVDSDSTTLSSVESYNIVTNSWSAAGDLTRAVWHAACVVYNNTVYVFGGSDAQNRPVAHVQVYSPAQSSCTLMSSQMPCAHNLWRAVLWETSVILGHAYTCLVYNFETTTWMERKQFMIGTSHFGFALDNQTIYVAGGGLPLEESDRTIVWKCTDQIKSMLVLDIIKNNPVVWKHHAKLSKPAMIQVYCTMALPSND